MLNWEREIGLRGGENRGRGKFGLSEEMYTARGERWSWRGDLFGLNWERERTKERWSSEMKMRWCGTKKGGERKSWRGDLYGCVLKERMERMGWDEDKMEWERDRNKREDDGCPRVKETKMDIGSEQVELNRRGKESLGRSSY